MIFTAEAFSGNQVFSQVLKETKTQQQRTPVAASAVRPRQATFWKNSNETSRRVAASKTKVQQSYALATNNSTTLPTFPTADATASSTPQPARPSAGPNQTKAERAKTQHAKLPTLPTADATANPTTQPAQPPTGPNPRK